MKTNHLPGGGRGGAVPWPIATEPLLREWEIGCATDIPTGTLTDGIAGVMPIGAGTVFGIIPKGAEGITVEAVDIGPIPRGAIPTVAGGTPTGATWATPRGTVIGGMALCCCVVIGMIGGAILGRGTPTLSAGPGNKGGWGMGGTAGGVLWSIFVVTPPEIKEHLAIKT